MYFCNERRKKEYCFLKIEALQKYYLCPHLNFFPQHKICPIYNQCSKPMFQT